MKATSHASFLLIFLTIALTLKVNAQSHRTGDAGSINQDQISKVHSKKKHYSPHVGRNFPTKPFFGDTHLHTAISFDAGMLGTRLMPADGYRFAKGDEVTSATGQRVKLSRPLDFLVVADHSDNMGFAPDFLNGSPNILAEPLGKRWYDMVQEGKVAEAFNELLTSFADGSFPEGLKYNPGNPAFKSTWTHILNAAENANEPGVFTAFIGYEWTVTDTGNNLHRNVIYRDGADKAEQMQPYTTEAPYGSTNPRDLWKWMDNYEKVTGGDILAIPHNGNVSNGRMFPIVEPGTDGKEIDSAYVSQRHKWEPLYEVVQTKGDSEAHPFLSPNDEFADYETWDIGNIALTEKKSTEMFEYEYARAAYKNGLKIEKKLGVNPYKFGLIGSTDSHIGISAVEEDNFFGKSALAEPSAHRWEEIFLENKELDLTVMNWRAVAGGYAAVWAEENTRESLFDAMERKETYATTGTRIVVRFFGGWEFNEKDAEQRMVADVGYAKGVPMGGDLYKATNATAPTFLVAALKDPIGANLDRIQIVKGWLDASGTPQEKVYNVVWADAEKRKIDRKGKIPLIGNTVDVKNATYTNTIGDTELISYWKDPDFNAKQRAFYYVRVLEIPTPRWTAYDAKYYGVKMDDEVLMEVIERAYTSPIWYNPN